MKIVPSVCCHDCGGACPLNIHIEAGRIVKIEARDVGLPALRPCSRGLLYHYRVYAPDRLKYPMKRIGERGEGRFTRVSWDEALGEIAERLTHIRDTYGPASILNLSFSGVTGRLHYGGAVLMRFLNMVGGQTSRWGGASYQGALFASLATYGRPDTGNDRADLLNSKMIILWGCNPAESIFGTETRWYITQAKEKGIRIVCIDPRFTESAATWASTWIPIRPGTDAAMAVAMAYVIIKQGLHKQCFLDRCTVGFSEFKDYVTGAEDGVAKTPRWAEGITGVPAETIEAVAIEYATSKPAAILTGFAPGRTSRGEQYHRATATLSAMTGNIGIPGGATACFDQQARAEEVKLARDYFIESGSDIPVLANPVEKGLPLHEYSVKGIRYHTVNKIHPSRMWDAILRGKAGGYFSDIKMLYVIGGDGLNQFTDTNRAAEAFRTTGFVVVHDQFMTPTARFADILLPITTWCERNDIKIAWLSFGRYVVYANKAIEPLYESRTDIDIFTALSKRMGVSGYNDKTEDEWLRLIANKLGIPDYDAFKSSGFYRLPTPASDIAFQNQVRDPDRYPFPTPSGKIEIFSQRIADFNRPDDLPSIPKYVAGWEGITDPGRKRYPLQLITTHSRKRTHSQFHNIPWYRNMEPHQVWINPVDARQRNINDGGLVKVFNDRGAITISAKVTNRIIPGVVNVYQGAWYDPDKSGIDRGGCANVLTRGEHSPGGAFCSNTTLVQVEKHEEE